MGRKRMKARGTLMLHQQHQVLPLSWWADEILACLRQEQDLAACLLEVVPRLGDVPLVGFEKKRRPDSCVISR